MWCLVAVLAGLMFSAAHAQEQKGRSDGKRGRVRLRGALLHQGTGHPVPAQPPVPPSPPRYGGVLQFPAAVRAFDPTVGYRPELALVWDTLTEWEATWYFPEVQRPRDPQDAGQDWEMENPSTWIFKLRQGVKFHNRPPVNGREMVAEDVKYSYEL